MARLVSDWRRRAEEVARRTLAALPECATLSEQRRALRAAYPFGAREHHPYRVWCDVVRKELGLSRRGRDPYFGPLPVPRRTGDRDLDRLLLALASEPADTLTLTALADLLEEKGDARADALRVLKPDPESVAYRLWPGSEVLSSYDGASGEPVMVLYRPGKPPLALAAFVADLEGRYLLTDPDVARAAAVERAALALALLSPH